MNMEWQSLKIALQVNRTLEKIKTSHQLNSKERFVQQANEIVLTIKDSHESREIKNRLSE